LRMPFAVDDAWVGAFSDRRRCVGKGAVLASSQTEFYRHPYRHFEVELQPLAGRSPPH
jgi:hypothetical protein